MSPAPSQLLTIGEAAERLNVSVRFIRRLVAERRLPYVKIGKYIRFDTSDLDTWINDRRIESHRTVVKSPKAS